VIEQIIQSTEEFFRELFPNNAEVVSIQPNNEGWQLVVEVVTDDEYTKKRIRNDLISVFKVFVDKDGNLISYNRIEIRERGKPVQKEDT